jgi:hypothetical protein
LTQNAKYISCFLSAEASTGDLCKALLNSVDGVLAIGDGVRIESGFVGEGRGSSLELQFAGRFFIYHQNEIGAADQEQLTEYARSRNVFIRFRAPRFAAKRTKLEKPLAFISHGSRDKDQIARPIAIGLS